MDRLGRFCLGIFPKENDLAYLMLGFQYMCVGTVCGEHRNSTFGTFSG